MQQQGGAGPLSLLTCAYQASCILQGLQSHVLLCQCNHGRVQLPAMHAPLRVEVMHKVCYRSCTLHEVMQESAQR